MASPTKSPAAPAAPSPAKGKGNAIKQSKGVVSQADVLTKRVCPICGNHMRQNEISVELAFRHDHIKGEPKRLTIFKHSKNCTPGRPLAQPA